MLFKTALGGTSIIVESAFFAEGYHWLLWSAGWQLQSRMAHGIE